MNYGDTRDKFSRCSNNDFKTYYYRVHLENDEFCLREPVTGCNCNGLSDVLGKGGECSDGPRGRWCYVNKNGCKDEIRHNGKYVSLKACEARQGKPCACNGETDFLGLGGSCDDSFCYVDSDSSCSDVTVYNGRTISRSVCAGRKTKPRGNTKRRPTERPRTQRPRTQRPRTQRPRTQRPRTQRPRTQRPRTTEKTTSANLDDKIYQNGDCDYECNADQACKVTYVGPRRSGPTSGRCFSKTFGGTCLYTPAECQECKYFCNK